MSGPKTVPAVYLCGGNLTPGPRDDCPDSLHNWPLPAGYVDAAEVRRCSPVPQVVQRPVPALRPLRMAARADQSRDRCAEGHLMTAAVIIAALILAAYIAATENYERKGRP